MLAVVVTADVFQLPIGLLNTVQAWNIEEQFVTPLKFGASVNVPTMLLQPN